MKTIENITLYKCDFCKKELKRKHSMVNHENKCSGNPLNFRPCLNGCKHLTQKDITYETGRDNWDGEPNYNNGKAFYCGFLDKFLLHPKVENEIGLKWIKCSDEEVEQESMPKECKSFDDGFNF